MGAQGGSALLGRIAVHFKWIRMEQLAEATREQARVGGSLGDALVAKGFVTPEQLAKLLAKQKELVAKHRAAAAAKQAAPGIEGAEQSAPAAAPKTPARAPEPGAAAPEPPRPAPAAEPAPDSRPPAPPRETAAAPVSAPAAAAQPAGPSRVAARSAPPRPSPELEQILRDAVGQGASDVHIHSGAPLKLRRNGSFVDVGDAPVTAPDAKAMVVGIMTESQRREFEAAGELDFAYTLADVGRFRVNAYRQQRGHDTVLRLISPEPPTLESLGLPLALAKLSNFHQGMVLFTGPSGCGKSSTMAALINLINEERREHLLTIEDPIECVHPSKRCLVNQRQVGPHTESFSRALRAALREDPDVIAIGELRDVETISLALTAAETGHFVLGSLHTNNAIRTINRLVGAFPPSQQDQIRTMISESLRAIVSQRLVPTADGSRRVAALEILKVNRAVGNLIRENKTFQILSILQTGSGQGMCLLDDSLAALVRDKTVTREAALLNCEDPKRIPG
ncbi:MAG: PilT/PilU family type 4a pilus ATPase [Myxococcota bacterium]